MRIAEVLPFVSQAIRACPSIAYETLQAQDARFPCDEHAAYLEGWAAALYFKKHGKPPNHVTTTRAVRAGLRTMRARLEKGQCPLCGGSLAPGNEASLREPIPCERSRTCGFRTPLRWIPIPTLHDIDPRRR